MQRLRTTIIFSLKILVGCGIWALVLLVLFLICHQGSAVYQRLSGKMLGQNPQEWFQERSREMAYLFRPSDLEVEFTDWVSIRPGDKLYLQKEATRQEIGVVYAKQGEGTKCVVHVRVYPQFVSCIADSNTFTLHNEPLNPRWIVNTLLPLARRLEMQQDLQEFFKNHWDEVRNLFTPLLAEVFQDSYRILQKNFLLFLAAHRDEIQTEVARLKLEYGEKQIIPIFEETIWPLLLAEARKEMEPVIQEMWEKFPKVELMLLWMYQALPGVANDHVRKRMEQYFQNQALPILKKHQQALEKIPANVMSQIAKDEKLRVNLRDLIKNVLEDRQLMEFAKELFIQFYRQNDQEILLEFRKKWNSPEFQNQWNTLLEELEPYLIRMVNRILLKPNAKEISPELAEVLRRQILAKDRYCLSTNAATTPATRKRQRFIGAVE